MEAPEKGRGKVYLQFFREDYRLLLCRVVFMLRGNKQF